MALARNFRLLALLADSLLSNSVSLPVRFSSTMAQPVPASSDLQTRLYPLLLEHGQGLLVLTPQRAEALSRALQIIESIARTDLQEWLARGSVLPPSPVIQCLAGRCPGLTLQQGLCVHALVDLFLFLRLCSRLALLIPGKWAGAFLGGTVTVITLLQLWPSWRWR